MEKQEPSQFTFSPIFMHLIYFLFLNFLQSIWNSARVGDANILELGTICQTSYNRTLDYKVTMQIHMLIFQNSRGTSPGSLNYLSWPSNGCSTTLQFRVSKASPLRSTMAETSEHDIGLEATLAGWPISLLAYVLCQGRTITPTCLRSRSIHQESSMSSCQFVPLV